MPLRVALLALLFTQAQATPLRIAVIAGEDAVNVIQQKTAVAPIVEIRDRNNVPVAGATVTFTIGGNSAAFAGGAQTVTVVTNAAGQATAAGLSPIASGAVQINVAAAFQGQTIAATIAQTNVMTAAEAASAASAAGGATGASGGSGGAASSAAGGAAGGGGGISATTIGIVGAAVGGGALAATQLADKVVVGKKEVAADIAIEITLVFSPDANGRSCTRLERYSGLFALEFDSLDSEPLNARATIEGGRSDIISTTSCPNGPQTGQTFPWGMNPTPATGPKSNITFTYAENFPSSTNTYSFQGALSGDTVTGTFRYSVRLDNGQFGIVNGTGSATVTLTPH